MGYIDVLLVENTIMGYIGTTIRIHYEMIIGVIPKTYGPFWDLGFRVYVSAPNV